MVLRTVMAYISARASMIFRDVSKPSVATSMAFWTSFLPKWISAPRMTATASSRLSPISLKRARASSRALAAWSSLPFTRCTRAMWSRAVPMRSLLSDFLATPRASLAALKAFRLASRIRRETFLLSAPRALRPSSSLAYFARCASVMSCTSTASLFQSSAFLQSALASISSVSAASGSSTASCAAAWRCRAAAWPFLWPSSRRMVRASSAAAVALSLACCTMGLFGFSTIRSAVVCPMCRSAILSQAAAVPFLSSRPWKISCASVADAMPSS
mmetsp:Transcript_2363/g.7049  ORF Transcript_2363/g.7049 Transcript_2363/m.7049 type:complete len:273 (-) Transcript_2363:949-1767(-)